MQARRLVARRRDLYPRIVRPRKALHLQEVAPSSRSVYNNIIPPHIFLVPRKVPVMTDARRNNFLDTGLSEDDQDDKGYDSEASEASKGGRSAARRPSTLVKRKRKISAHEEDEDEVGGLFSITTKAAKPKSESSRLETTNGGSRTPGKPGSQASIDARFLPEQHRKPVLENAESPKEGTESTCRKIAKAGVVYLTSLPPYLKPAALRTLFERRGFGPINRLFLTPASTTTTSTSRHNKRQTYAEGWVEFASKKTAKIAVETMNAQIIGGKKGGWYHDDLLNMRYLRGMKWDDLMAQFREEKREEEVRREAERERAKKETKAFMEGVERSKAMEGMEKKRKGKRKRDGEQVDETAARDPVDVKAGGRNWEQFEVQDNAKRVKEVKHGLNDDVRSILSKIF